MPTSSRSTASSSETGSDREDFSDWASSLHGARRTQSLFDADTVLDTPEECLEHDERVHGYNVQKEGERLGLDDYGRIRLINYIRREKPSVEHLKALKPDDQIFEDELNLKPVLEDDPLLQICFADSWSDDEEPSKAQAESKPSASTSNSTSTNNNKNSTNNNNLSQTTLAALQAQLAQAEAKNKTLQAVLDRVVLGSGDGGTGVGAVGDSESGSESESESGSEVVGKGKGRAVVEQEQKAKGKGKGKGKMDIDTHYFDSYASNDIHETMLKDTVRTMSYGEFILNNPGIFKDAIVMDVGCGSGILSMFAARAGAKHVYAIEASGLAHKARKNIANNGLQDRITVVQGKVEEIELPLKGKEVDVIVSEWMGYMLLYESMLDSVLHARDRFMRPGGLMVPSQTRIMLAGMTGERIYEEAFGFWDEVYGFDLSAMKPTQFEDGIVEVVDAKEVMTTECALKDIDTNRVTVPELDFKSPFVLNPVSTSDSSPTKMRAFLTWFDTFFSPDASHEGQAPLARDTQYVKYEEDAYRRDVPVVSAKKTGNEGEGQKKGKEVSFTTGPRGKATHWKQVAFMLKEPVEVPVGHRIEGTFHCRKSRSGNTRELDVEIHWKVLGPNEREGDVRERYDVFRVC